MFSFSEADWSRRFHSIVERLRTSEENKTLAIFSGNICAGKTTMMKRVAKELNSHDDIQAVTINEFPQRFNLVDGSSITAGQFVKHMYEGDISESVFQIMCTFFKVLEMNRYMNRDDVPKKTVVCMERGPLDSWVFSQGRFKAKPLDDVLYRTLLLDIQHLFSSYFDATVYVHVHAPVPELLNRLRGVDRETQSSDSFVSKEYLTSLQNRYKEMFSLSSPFKEDSITFF